MVSIQGFLFTVIALTDITHCVRIQKIDAMRYIELGKSFFQEIHTAHWRFKMTTEDMAANKKPLERPPLAELARKVLLASIGAVALAQEEADAFIQKLVEKGELAEKDGTILMKDFREKRKKKAEELMEKRISSLIDRMNIPTKSDIDTLSEKINEIAEKVEKLK